MQYISNAYKNILGRMDSGGVTFWNNVLTASPNLETLKYIGKSFYSSAEFNSRNYTSTEKILSLYHFALNREADLSGMWHHSQSLEKGRSFTSIVDEFFNSKEFAINSSKYLQTQYDFNTAIAPLRIGANTPGLRIATQQQLQDYLYSASLETDPAKRIVTLAQAQTIELTKNLYIPDKVTLETWGSPDPSNYLKQTRLIRGVNFTNGSLISSSGTIKNLWIDGNRNTVGNPNYNISNVNIDTYKGLNLQIIDNRIENTLGFTSINLVSSDIPNNTAIVSGNFIDLSYSSNLKNWSDGISVSHKNAIIQYNTIVNSTDVGIVLFAYDYFGKESQNSIVRGNRIYNVSNSAFAALTLDGVYNQSGSGSKPNTTASNAYLAQFTNNELYTSKSQRYNIALAVGTRIWFGNNNGLNVNGGTFTDNFSIEPVRVATVIFVSGALNVNIGNNPINYTFAPEANKKILRKPHLASFNGYASFNSSYYSDWVNFDLPGGIR